MADRPEYIVYFKENCETFLVDTLLEAKEMIHNEEIPSNFKVNDYFLVYEVGRKCDIELELKIT